MNTYANQVSSYLFAQSWQIALLAGIVGMISFAIKNRSAHTRYLLWLIVLAKCLVPPVYSLPVAVLPERSLTEHSMQPELPQRPANNSVVMNAGEHVTIEEVLEPRQVRPAVPNAKETIVLVWLTGILLFLSWVGSRAVRYTLWLHCRKMLLPLELYQAFEELFAGFKIKKSPRIWLTRDIAQPFVWGLFRGSIYLPSDFTGLDSPQHHRTVLAHELSHIARFDAAVNALQVLAQAIYWFHPLVWWTNRKIRQEREKCCDEMAVAQLSAPPEHYTDAIVEALAAERRSAHPVPSLAIVGSVKDIEERIKTMLRPGKKFYKRPSVIAAMSILLIATLTVPTALVLTARAGTRTEETGRAAEVSLERATDISQLSESNNKVTCTGKVIDTQGEPIAGAKVTAYESHFDMAGSILLHQVSEVTTAEDGAFVFVTKPKPERGEFDECYIVATKQDLALGWTDWTMREDVESNIELGEPEKLEGVIVDEAGKQVADAEVRANLYRTVETADGEEKREWLPGIPPLGELITQTKRQGRFLFNNLPADFGVDLLVMAAGKATTYTYRSEPREPTFKAGQTDIRVVLPAEARIEGQIVDPDTGKGIARTKFAVVDPSGLFYYRFVYTTDDDGKFSIGGLQTGRYGLLKGIFPHAHVDVKSGKTTKLTIRARTYKPHYFHVLLENGSPAVIKPEQKILVRFEENEGVQDVGYIDVDGYLKVYLSQREYRKWQLDQAWFVALIPNNGGKSFRREFIFSYYDLIKDWPKNVTAKKAKPKDESGVLVGKSLPGMKDFGVDLLSDEANNKMILVCFWDMQQRPSRNCIVQLAKRAEELKEKGVTVVVIQAAIVEQAKLDEWIEENNIAFPVGMIQDDEEKIHRNWGIRSLPWLILTDKEHIVTAEGFSIGELYERITTLREK